jgi:hypothetical protein
MCEYDTWGTRIVSGDGEKCGGEKTHVKIRHVGHPGSTILEAAGQVKNCEYFLLTMESYDSLGRSKRRRKSAKMGVTERAA